MATKKSRTSNKKSSDKQKKLLALALVVLFIGLGVLLVVSSFAARRTSNSYNLATAFAAVDSMGNPLQGDKNSDGVINFGDTILYTFTWPNTGGLILADTTCTQNGANVYNAHSNYGSDGTLKDTPWPWTQWVALGSGAWVSGGANCTAKLYSVTTSGSGKIMKTTLGTINFTVYP